MHTDQRAGEARLTLVTILVLGVVAALMRAAPYYLRLPAESAFLWNLMPIGALCLFAGSRLRSRSAWLVPLGVMLVSDLLIAYPLWKMGYPAFSLTRTPIIYLSFAAYVALGRMIRPGELSPPVIGGAALLASVQFFVLTNFASWLVDIQSALPDYTPTPGGLAACFLAGIPFYKQTLAADLLGSALIFAAHAALVHALRRAPGVAPAVPTGWAGRSDRHGVTRRDEVRR
jgi:hypothetical protein